MELEKGQKRWLDRKSYFCCDGGQGYDKRVVALSDFICDIRDIRDNVLEFVPQKEYNKGMFGGII